MSQMKPLYAFPSYFFTIHYITILISMQVASLIYFSSPNACLYFSSQDLRDSKKLPEF